VKIGVIVGVGGIREGVKVAVGNTVGEIVRIGVIVFVGVVVKESIFLCVHFTSTIELINIIEINK
jgi:hypothetical protein